MQVNDLLGCKELPCEDVRKECYTIPQVKVRPESIKLVMISEAAPQDVGDSYYADGNPLFEQTTVQAFRDAGIEVSSMRDLLKSGVYCTTAVKCGKTGYAICAGTIKECSSILEKELDQFRNASVLMLMGDVAIKALNHIARRAGQKRAIPAGSTYKIRSQDYSYRGQRVFPSYLQAGPSFFIEKSKRKMIAEDIATAMKPIE